MERDNNLVRCPTCSRAHGPSVNHSMVHAACSWYWHGVDAFWSGCGGGGTTPEPGRRNTGTRPESMRATCPPAPRRRRVRAYRGITSPRRGSYRGFDRHWMRQLANRRRALQAFGSTVFAAPLSDGSDAGRHALRLTPESCTKPWTLRKPAGPWIPRSGAQTARRHEHSCAPVGDKESRAAAVCFQSPCTRRAEIS